VLFRLSLRVFIIGLLVLSSLWVGATFVPVLYSMVFPPRDIHDIVRALEQRGNAPPGMATTVAEQIIAQAGPMQKALQVGYHSEVSARLQLNNSHTTRTTQVSYVAWFQKIPKPILLLIERSETDGVLQGYQINEGAPMSLIGSFAFPLAVFAFALFLFLRRNSPMFRGSDGNSADASHLA
jgi:hypothetical protein